MNQLTTFLKSDECEQIFYYFYLFVIINLMLYVYSILFFVNTINYEKKNKCDIMINWICVNKLYPIISLSLNIFIDSLVCIVVQIYYHDNFPFFYFILCRYLSAWIYLNYYIVDLVTVENVNVINIDSILLLLKRKIIIHFNPKQTKNI